MSENNTDFLHRFQQGSFTSALRWPQLDALWQAVLEDSDGGWYLYAVGETPPTEPASAERVESFVREIDSLLRREHDENYCGIVYADDLQKPDLIKIYDPNNLGVVCGFSDNPPLPGWVMSKQQPVDLPMARQPDAGRRRWWQRVFSR